MDAWRIIRELAGPQHGLVARYQLTSAGLHSQQVSRLVGRGALVHITPRVLKVSGSATSRWESVMAGILDVAYGAMASHHTAAAMWGVSGIAAEPVHVSVPRALRRHPPTAVTVHHLTVVPEDQRAALHEIPVTGPELTTLLLFGSSKPYLGATALDHFLATRDSTVASMWHHLERMARRGRNGIVDMRSALETRSDGDMPPQSNNERRFEHITYRGGITSLERQVDVWGPGWIGRVDYRDRWYRNLIVEVHSERYHSTTSHRRRDAERLQRLRAAGYVVVVVWDYEIWTTPELVLERIDRVRRAFARS